jgi:excinuclease ABC subunit C
VSNYARPSGHSARIARMIRETASDDVPHDPDRDEALLLEQNLIKQLKPRYNVLLRDDKSFPNIIVSAHRFPRSASTAARAPTRATTSAPSPARAR